MAQVFNFPCPECRQSLRVESKQAGQELPCPECHQVFTVPTMRELKRQGEVISQAAGPAQVRPNFLRSTLFAVGLIIALVGFVGGFLLSDYAKNLIVEVKVEETVQQLDEAVDQMTPAQLWGNWKGQLQNRELPEWQRPEWQEETYRGKVLQGVAYGVMGAGALGLVLFALSFVPWGQPRRKR